MKKKIGSSKTIKKMAMGGDDLGDRVKGVAKAAGKAVMASPAGKVINKVSENVPAGVKAGIKKGIGMARKLTGLKKGGSVKGKKK
jgi:hypothetical protein